MKAIVPVAGNGTRLFPIGVTTPKALVPILGKPLIIWSLEKLQRTGIDEVIVVISGGVMGELIKNRVSELVSQHQQLASLTITFVIQKQQLGTAHVVQEAREHFSEGEEFIFIYGDDLYNQEVINQVVNSSDLIIAGQKVSDPEKWGILQTNDDGNLTSVIEKPSEPVGDLANIGCMKLSSRVFKLFEEVKISDRGEYELTDSLTLLAKESTIKVISNPGYWQPIGYPWHILEATQTLLPEFEITQAGKISENAHISGEVHLPESSEIKAGCVIEGTLVVGENTVIGPNAYICGTTVIGNNCHIGNNAEIESSVYGNNIAQKHFSYVGSSIIGSNVTIGAGTVASNIRHDKKTVKTVIKGNLTDTGLQKFGTVIGDNVRLGVNTSIYPGRKIWPDKTTRPGQTVDKDITD